MKRYIGTRQPIFAMALPRKTAITKLQSIAPEFAEHIMKSVIFLDTTQNLRHWVFEEISNWVDIANTIRVKPNNKKLSTDDYLEYFFAEFGEEPEDVKVILGTMISTPRFRRDYGNVELTPKLVNSVWACEQEIMKYLLPILTSVNTISADTIANEVYDIITKYGKLVEKNNAK